MTFLALRLRFRRTVACHSPCLTPVLACALVLGACTPAQPPKPGTELRTLRIDEPFPESPQFGLLSAQVNHRELLSRIAALATDPKVSGVFVQLGEMDSAWARVADIRDALAEVHKAKKPVHCYFESTDNLGYALLAETCDHISMTPSGMLNLVGVAASAVYAHELLQNVGLDAELLQIGRFKGAADPLTRDDMPEPVRQTMGAILDGLQGRVLAAVARRGSLSPERAQALIDQGPFTADQARRAGLVDDIQYDDGARAVAKRAAHAARVVEEALHPEHPSLGLLDLLRALMGRKQQHEPKGDRIVLAYLDGTITRGSASSLESGGAESFVGAMRGFADDPHVRAVVLRIDSPGGSALAADLMWHAVRRLQKRKPVIVSIGDMCASGGYYVASAGSEILAQPDSLVGSIGVVGGKLVVSDLAQRIGVHFTELKRGQHAGWTSALQPFTDSERAAFEQQLQATYELFLARIGEGRKLARQAIEPYAEGRLMLGSRAREAHLVDTAGGLRDAMARARDRAHLAPDAPVQVWPQRQGLLQALSALTGETRSDAAGDAGGERAWLVRMARSQHMALIETLLSGDGLQAAVLPYVLSVH